jgi:hypothetical protein
MLKRYVLSVWFALLLAPTAVLGDELETIRELLDRFLAGASVDDAAMHQRFWAEDLVYTSSSGARYGKPQIMQGMRSPDPDEAEGSEDGESNDAPAVYSADQVQIRLLADDIAVVTFRLVATPDSGPVDYFLNTGVFQRRDGQWRASTWQATRVPPADD